MQGWVKLHRNLEEWEWYKTPNMVHFFIHCLLRANHKPKKWQGVQVESGEFISGRKKLSEETGLSEQSVRTCINRLKSTNELTIKTTTKYSLFRVNNWNNYQSEKEPTSTSTNSQPTTNQQLTTNKNVKNVKNSLVFKIPEISEVAKYCDSRKNGVNPRRWFDFYSSKGWMVGKNKMKDWRACVRTWEKGKPEKKDYSNEPFQVQDALR